MRKVILTTLLVMLCLTPLLFAQETARNGDGLTPTVKLVIQLLIAAMIIVCGTTLIVIEKKILGIILLALGIIAALLPIILYVW